MDPVSSKVVVGQSNSEKVKSWFYGGMRDRVRMNCPFTNTITNSFHLAALYQTTLLLLFKSFPYFVIYSASNTLRHICQNAKSDESNCYVKARMARFKTSFEQVGPWIYNPPSAWMFFVYFV